MPPASTTVALTIAGSDSGGGAGIQADLKTFAAHGVFGTSALTLVTAQNTQAVTHVELMPPDVVTKQIRAVLDDFPVRAIKTGALGNAAIIRAVAAALREARVPIVIDPVMVAKSGDSLLDPAAVEALMRELLPLAAIVTPNVPEAAALFGLDAGAITHDDMADLANALRAEAPCAVLLKGGHLDDDTQTVTDWLVTPNNVTPYASARIDTRHTHGTGCTLSAAIAARLAHGDPMDRAVRTARDYLVAAIEQAPGLGEGHGPLQHFPLQPDAAADGGAE